MKWLAGEVPGGQLITIPLYDRDPVVVWERAVWTAPDPGTVWSMVDARNVIEAIRAQRSTLIHPVSKLPDRDKQPKGTKQDDRRNRNDSGRRTGRDRTGRVSVHSSGDPW